jgi:serine/threonine protein kinase/tetratricopeptide (TPR) repeat protein
MALAAGSQLGPYEIVELLGSGGMGEVYRARDPRLGREVAIKVLLDGVVDREHLRRFEQEARAAGALNHPSIVAVHDVGTDHGAPYVVSELLEGQTLRRRLDGGPLSLPKTLDVALQIARGLAAAHDKGIVHRDLKPENIFITDDNRAKILDFGLAKLMRPGTLAVGDGAGDNETTTGTVLGTVGYMSPEQVRGQAVDHRADVFSFGAVLYEMLSGVRAFRRDSAVETMNAILKDDPTERSGAGQPVPPALLSIVRRCLEKRARDRFHSAHDLAFVLEAAVTGTSEEATRQHVSSAATPEGSPAKRQQWILLATLVAVGGMAVYRSIVSAPAAMPPPVIESLAVLPFENVGGDPNREYLSDGVAETLINKLSRVPHLKVMARSTSFRFRGKDVDPRQVGRDLQVGAVLTGHVSLRGDTLVVGAELVDVGRGTQLWGDLYNTRMGDILAVEENIFGEISRKLRLKLPRSDESGVSRRATEDTEAYRLFLRSRYEINSAKPEGLNRAVEYAQQATARDPTYAPAYAALARAYNFLGRFGLLSNREANTRVRAASMKALEIDESLAEAHAALGGALWLLDWDWAAADRQFKRAIELDPNAADAHEDYSVYLAVMGRFEEGLAHAKRAVELDPLTPARRAAIGLSYYFARQFDEALGAFGAALEFDRNLDFHPYLGWIYREKGMYEQAIAEYRKSLESNPRSPHLLGHLGNIYARAGRGREARECLRKLKDRSRDEKVGTYEVAFIHAALGEKDEAFEWLEKAYGERNQGLAFLKVDPTLDPLRSDPRFERLLRRMNL